MMRKKQIEQFNSGCAKWLEGFLKINALPEIKSVYEAGKEAGYTRAQIKAARSWYGKWIATVGNRWSRNNA